MISDKMAFCLDWQGMNTFVPQQTTLRYSAVLAADTPDTLTVPTSAENFALVIVSYAGAPVWFSVNGTAEYPSGAMAATTSYLAPFTVKVKGGDIISLVSPLDDVPVSALLFELQQ